MLPGLIAAEGHLRGHRGRATAGATISTRRSRRPGRWQRCPPRPESRTLVPARRVARARASQRPLSPTRPRVTRARSRARTERAPRKLALIRAQLAPPTDPLAARAHKARDRIAWAASFRRDSRRASPMARLALQGGDRGRGKALDVLVADRWPLAWASAVAGNAATAATGPGRSAGAAGSAAAGLTLRMETGVEPAAVQPRDRRAARACRARGLLGVARRVAADRRPLDARKPSSRSPGRRDRCSAAWAAGSPAWRLAARRFAVWYTHSRDTSASAGEPAASHQAACRCRRRGARPVRYRRRCEAAARPGSARTAR
jgi:hypothetical protein